MTDDPPNPLIALIDRYREAKGLSREAASLAAGLSRDFLRKLEERGPGASARMSNLTKLAEAIELPLAELAAALPREPGILTRPSEVRPADVPIPRREDMPRNVPVYGTAAGSALGRGAFQLTPDVIDWVRRPPGLAGVKDAYALYVENDSMEPLYSPGSLIYVHPHKPPARGDSVVVQEAVSTNDVQAYVKKYVARTGEHVITQQFNPPAEIKFRRDRIRYIHKVLTLNELMGV